MLVPVYTPFTNKGSSIYYCSWRLTILIASILSYLSFSGWNSVMSEKKCRPNSLIQPRFQNFFLAFFEFMIALRSAVTLSKKSWERGCHYLMTILISSDVISLNTVNRQPRHPILAQPSAKNIFLHFLHFQESLIEFDKVLQTQVELSSVNRPQPLSELNFLW